MDGWYRRPSRPPSLLCRRVQARGAPANIHACAVGLMEAHGTTHFTHGSTCTDWKPWKRIECTELFPDVRRRVLCRTQLRGRDPKHNMRRRVFPPLTLSDCEDVLPHNIDTP